MVSNISLLLVGAVAAFIKDVDMGCLAIPLFAFLAFQIDGILAGAESTLNMRKDMFTAFSVFVRPISLLSAGFFDTHYLDGLVFAFILYLIIRGINLVACLPSFMCLSQESGS
tara:strand:+ start:2032 stop:2370 length:339 start_codon:yes stop_codon:yes gene_type:complete